MLNIVDYSSGTCILHFNRHIQSKCFKSPPRIAAVAATLRRDGNPPSAAWQRLKHTFSPSKLALLLWQISIFPELPNLPNWTREKGATVATMCIKKKRKKSLAFSPGAIIWHNALMGGNDHRHRGSAENKRSFSFSPLWCFSLSYSYNQSDSFTAASWPKETK